MRNTKPGKVAVVVAAALGIALAASACGDSTTTAPELPFAATVTGSINGTLVDLSAEAMLVEKGKSGMAVEITTDDGKAYSVEITLKDKDLAVGDFDVTADATSVVLVLPGLDKTTVKAGTISVTAWDGVKSLTLTVDKIEGEGGDVDALGQIILTITDPTKKATEAPAADAS